MPARSGGSRAHDRLGRRRTREAHADAHEEHRDGEPAVARSSVVIVAAIASPPAKRQHARGHDALRRRTEPTSFDDSGAATIIAPAYGSMRTPAADGE